MSTQAQNPGYARRKFWALVQAWSFALVASFLVAAPTIRTNELNEVEAAKEVVEDAAYSARTVNKRSHQPVRREAIVFTNSIQARLGRQRDVEPSRIDGHRMPNGLLAPMTC